MSAGGWIAHALLVVPAAHRALAAQLYASATGRVEDAAPETFSVRLCASGGAEVTHYAAHTRIRDTTLAALGQLAAAIPGGLWVVTAHDEDTADQAAARLSVDAWLATQGLVRWYEPEEGDDE
jgi:hypothetical protein